MITISKKSLDASLDRLLDLDGQVRVIDDAGCRVRFVVHRVPVTADKPHGLDDTLTLHALDGTRWVGFDNAHPVRRGRFGVAGNPRQGMRHVGPCDYSTADGLIAAFWNEVESVMKEKGVWK